MPRWLLYLVYMGRRRLKKGACQYGSGKFSKYSHTSSIYFSKVGTCIERFKLSTKDYYVMQYTLLILSMLCLLQQIVIFIYILRLSFNKWLIKLEIFLSLQESFNEYNQIYYQYLVQTILNHIELINDIYNAITIVALKYL